MHQRLFEITLLLTRKGSATATELADRFGVSTRTIYRDIDALSAAGVPVYTEKGHGGGIRMLADHVLDKTLFSKEEQAQLVAHFDSLSALGAPDAEKLLDKLGALFGQGQSWLEVDYAPWGGGEEMRALMNLLRDAVLGRRVITFGYAGANGKPSQRTAEPYKVVFRGQGWYLHAYCRTRGAYRFFKLTRMRGAALTGEAFAPREDVPPPFAESYSGASIHVRLRLAPALAFRALDEFAQNQLTPTGDGGYIAECDFPSDGNWLVGYLMSFGPGAEVLEPVSLRRLLARQLARMAKQYRL